MALAAERCDLCLAGNHDLAVTGALDIAEFSRWPRSPRYGHKEVIARRPSIPARVLLRRRPGAGRGTRRRATRLGVRLHRRWGALHGRDGVTGRRNRTLAPRALVSSQQRGRAAGRGPRGLEPDLSEGWCMNPGGVGQPATVTAGRVAPARYRGVERGVAAGRISHTTPRRPILKQGCPRSSPNASTTDRELRKTLTCCWCSPPAAAPMTKTAIRSRGGGEQSPAPARFHPGPLRGGGGRLRRHHPRPGSEPAGRAVALDSIPQDVTPTCVKRS